MSSGRQEQGPKKVGGAGGGQTPTYRYEDRGRKECRGRTREIERENRREDGGRSRREEREGGGGGWSSDLSSDRLDGCWSSSLIHAHIPRSGFLQLRTPAV